MKAKCLGEIMTLLTVEQQQKTLLKVEILKNWGVYDTFVK